MVFRKLTVPMRYDVISEYNDIITVAFSTKLKDEWNISLIIAGESMDIQKRLDNLGW